MGDPVQKRGLAEPTMRPVTVSLAVRRPSPSHPTPVLLSFLQHLAFSDWPLNAALRDPHQCPNVTDLPDIHQRPIGTASQGGASIPIPSRFHPWELLIHHLGVLSAFPSYAFGIKLSALQRTACFTSPTAFPNLSLSSAGYLYPSISHISLTQAFTPCS